MSNVGMRGEYDHPIVILGGGMGGLMTAVDFLRRRVKLNVVFIPLLASRKGARDIEMRFVAFDTSQAEPQRLYHLGA